MVFKAALFIILPYFLTISTAKNQGYYNLPFNVTNEVDYQDSLVKREDDTINFDLTKQSSFYTVDLVIGSQKEEVKVLLDTGSSDLWVMGSDNTLCSTSTQSKFRLIDDTYNTFKEQGLDNPLEKRSNCAQYGTFDSSKSKTFKLLNTDFYIKYGDSSFASGQWGTDSLSINGLSVTSLQFAVCSQANTVVGVLGIGLEDLETTYSGISTGNNKYTYPNLPSKLVEDGFINRKVYSLYLNPNGASGNVLFGGIDYAKFSGELQIVDLVNTLSSYGYSKPIQFEIAITSFTVGDTQIFSSGSFTGLLDSGSTYSYFPSDIVANIASAAGATLDSSSGYYIMDCTSTDKTFVFQFGSATITVPISNFLQSVTGAPKCILTILPRSSTNFILGDTFLKSTYVFYDLDNYQVGLAQAITSSDSHIEAVVDSILSRNTDSDEEGITTTITSETGATTALSIIQETDVTRVESVSTDVAIDDQESTTTDLLLTTSDNKYTNSQATEFTETFSTTSSEMERSTTILVADIYDTKVELESTTKVEASLSSSSFIFSSSSSSSSSRYEIHSTITLTSSSSSSLATTLQVSSILETATTSSSSSSSSSSSAISASTIRGSANTLAGSYIVHCAAAIGLIFL